MYVFWKPLIFLGLLFWIVLYSTDAFKEPRLFQIVMPQPPPLYLCTRKSFNIMTNDTLDKNESNSQADLTKSQEKLSSTFGGVMLLANLIILTFSLIFCSIVKVIASVISKNYKNFSLEPATILTKTEEQSVQPEKKESFVQIEEIIPTESDVTTEEKKSITSDVLCEKKSQICQTLFHVPLSAKNEQYLRSECIKLKEELTVLQSNSVKEHALLSTKLSSMIRDKKDLIKRFATIQKENLTAKNQLEEIMNEKESLQKRLECATKEFRVNTKSKKVALAKLENISVTVEDLKRQLEQVTRDKEILQNKLEVLRNEYEKLQDRLRVMQMKETHRLIEEKTITDDAEKDIELKKFKLNEEDQATCDSSLISLNENISKESVFVPYVISQTELEMKNIQKKILQLENNLKDFNLKSDCCVDIGDGPKDETDLTSSNLYTSSEDNFHLGLGVIKNIKNVSPRNDITCRKTYDEIRVEMLRNTMREKIRILENIKENGDQSEFTSGGASGEEFDISSEESISTLGIISNSSAFQKFLKNIDSTDTTKMFKINEHNLSTD